MARKLDMMTLPELKFKDIDLNDTSIGQAGTVTAISLLAEGVGSSERIGRKVTLKHVSWRISLNTIAAADLAAGDICRFMLVQDTQPNGALPSAAQILAGDNFQSYNNLDRSGRFRTVWDKTVAVNCLYSAGNGTSNDSGATFVHLEMYKKIDFPIEFSATTALITSVQTNSLIALVLSAVGEKVNMDSKLRFRFVG